MELEGYANRVVVYDSSVVLVSDGESAFVFSVSEVMVDVILGKQFRFDVISVVVSGPLSLIS